MDTLYTWQKFDKLLIIKILIICKSVNKMCIYSFFISAFSENANNFDIDSKEDNNKLNKKQIIQFPHEILSL